MTIGLIEWVLVVRYGKTDHARIYRRLNAGTYTGDYIQLTDAALPDLEEVFPDFSGGVAEIPLIYQWPTGQQNGSLVRQSADRPHLKWETNEAPPPWKMGKNPSKYTVETIPGDPSHTDANLADAEFANLDAIGFGQPFLIAVKLHGETNKLHLRVLVENPMSGFEWADLSRAPKAIQDVAARTNNSRRKAWQRFDGPSSTSKLFFDTDKKIEPWTSSPTVLATAKTKSGNDSDFIAEKLDVDEATVAEFEKSIDEGNYNAEDKLGTTKIRGSAQRAFSERVKENYGWKCALTNISSREYLIGSHIVPWSVDEDIRLDPSNGICLSVLVDKAFENGHLIVQDDLSVTVDYEKIGADDALKEALSPFDGKKLRKPVRQQPKATYLKRRRDLPV